MSGQAARPVVRHLPVGLAVCAVAWLPLGCGSAGELRDASGPGGSYARVAVALVHQHDDPPGRVHLEAGAQFVRYRNAGAAGIDALLGHGPEDLARGECRLVDRRARSVAALGADGLEPEVELLDAGDLLVRGPAGQSALTARRYPDVVPFLTGVYYGTTEPPLELAAAGVAEVQVSGGGGPEVGPFAVAVPLPLEAPQGDVAWVAAGLELRWAAAREPEGLRVEVRGAPGDGARAVVCAAGDDGAFTVPAALVVALGSRELQVVTARQRRQPFAAAGVGGGELVLALRDVTTLTVPLLEARPR